MSRVLGPTVQGIRDLIEESLEPDERLPSEQELMERFAVSRATIREAVTRLETIGLVEKRWGVGTFVATPKPPTAFGIMSVAGGIPGVLSTTGGKSSVHRFEIETLPADPEAFPEFPAAELSLVRRVLALDGVPAIVIEDRVVSEFDGKRVDFSPLGDPAALMAQVLRAIGIELAGIDSDLFATDLDERGRELLDVVDPEPVIETLSTGFDVEGRRILQTHLIYRTRLLRLRVTAN